MLFSSYRAIFANQRRTEAPSADVQQKAAYELVDWFRLVNQPVTASDIVRLIAVIERFWKPALKEFMKYLSPEQMSSWFKTKCVSPSGEIQYVSRVFHMKQQDLKVFIRSDFDDLVWQLNEECLNDLVCQNAVVSSLFTGPPKVYDLKRALRALLHRLAASTDRVQTASGLLALLAAIMSQARGVIDPNSFNELQHLCLQSSAIRFYCNKPLSEALRRGNFIQYTYRTPI